jgi:hypothetical protein
MRGEHNFTLLFFLIAAFFIHPAIGELADSRLH